MIIIGEEYEAIKELALRIAEKKKDNPAYKRDNHKVFERYFRGLIAERAVEQQFDVKVIDWEAETYGSKFEKPDIECMGVGVKAYDLGHYPLIYRDNKYPQIFVCVHFEADYAIATIKGLATVNVLNHYQDDKYVIDKKCLWSKTAFVGLDQLITLENAEWIKVLLDGKKVVVQYANKE